MNVRFPERLGREPALGRRGRHHRRHVGVGSSTNAADGHDPEILLARADADMYNTKATGAARRSIEL